MLNRIKRVGRSSLNFADGVGRRLIPTYRAKRKYASELDYWKGELDHLRKWYQDGAIDWWGIPPPPSEKKQTASDIWAVNAVMTMHDIRPSYLEELQLERDSLRGKRVLEVGCGPLAPILQFSDCSRHGLDPLIDLYLQAGWPLYGYDVKFISAKGESMPYVDSYFDAVISVNALDHVDDFRQVASEIHRVVKDGGELYFEIEYHAPTVNEPQRLNDAVVLESFSACEMRKVCERGKRELFQAVVKRFGLLPGKFDHITNEERFVTWHGKRLR